MTYQLSWHIPDRVLQVTYTGDIGIEEVKQANQASKDMLDTSSYPIVHMIGEISGMTRYPIQIRQLNEVGDVMGHPKLGWFVLVGSTTMQNFIVSVMSNTFRLKVKQARTVEDAMAILQRVDPSLAPK